MVETSEVKIYVKSILFANTKILDIIDLEQWHVLLIDCKTCLMGAPVPEVGM